MPSPDIGANRWMGCAVSGRCETDALFEVRREEMHSAGGATAEAERNQGRALAAALIVRELCGDFHRGEFPVVLE
jgi:hypothetical protein